MVAELYADPGAEVNQIRENRENQRSKTLFFRLSTPPRSLGIGKPRVKR
jgi:hypothetical protein